MIWGKIMYPLNILWNQASGIKKPPSPQPSPAGGRGLEFGHFEKKYTYVTENT
jgi:hypothetical protein